MPNDYTLRALLPADPRNIAGESDSVTLQVQHKQIAGFTIASSEPIATGGTAVTISGVLDAARTTSPEATTQVTLYGKQNGTVSPDKTRHEISLQRLGADGSWHEVEPTGPSRPARRIRSCTRSGGPARCSSAPGSTAAPRT